MKKENPSHLKFIKIPAYFCLFNLITYIIIFSSFADAAQESNLLLTIPPIISAHVAGQSPDSTPPDNPPPGGSLSLSIYVAGESVEQFNHYKNTPLNTDGSLNNLGESNNAQDEYGWTIPFAQRLKIRDPNISINWVGSDCWYNQDTWECSEGALTNSNIGQSSSQAGSTIEDWNANHRSELTEKQYCYDVAFASRGGNDLNNGVPVNTYRDQLRTLIKDLDKGSNCRAHPVIYVTAHLLDIAGWNYEYQQADINAWMNTQEAYYVTVAKELVSELNNQNGMVVRFIDMWTPFYEDRATKAFPAETWWTVLPGTGAKMPDMDKIHRNDGQHPKRLASIFAGENVADQVNIQELKTLLAK